MAKAKNNALPENPEGLPAKTGITNIPASTPRELKLDRETSAQKEKYKEGFIKKYAKKLGYSENHPVVGTLLNILTMKPVQGVVDIVTFDKVPVLGKIARAAAIAAGIYFGVGALKSGAVTAFGGGNILLDRLGPGAGQLFPPMPLQGAPADLQGLPGIDIWANR